MFCPQCGGQLKPDARFCPACGHQLPGAAGPAADAADTTVMPPVASDAGSSGYISDAVYPTAAVATVQTPQPAAGQPAAQDPAWSQQPPGYPPQQPTVPPKSGDGLVWVAVIVAVLVLVVGGGALAWQQGWLDGVLGRESSEATASKDEKKKSDDATEDANQGGAEDDGSGDGTTGGSGGDTSTTGALSAEDSYLLLAEHYGKVWDLHVAIGLQDEGAYTGTGFVFEPGGFNASIGHSDKQVRRDLVPRCKYFVDEVTDWRAQLEMAVVDPAYETDRRNIVELYGYLFERADALYQAAAIAVDNPDRDTGWGSALQPRSQNGRKAFEEHYPGYEPYRR